MQNRLYHFLIFEGNSDLKIKYFSKKKNVSYRKDLSKNQSIKDLEKVYTISDFKLDGFRKMTVKDIPEVNSLKK